MLAQTYSGQNPAGLLMSEKLDGIRAIWTGSQFVSRNGKILPCPPAYAAAMPTIPLDLELWIGRGMFAQTLSSVKNKRSDWSDIKCRVFDYPAPFIPFSQRLAIAAHACEKSTVCEIVPHIACTGPQHLAEYLETMLTAGAEGLILRSPHAEYDFCKRSPGVLKLKPWEDDEGELIATEPGTGQFLNQIGALLLSWRGLTVRIGSGLSNAVRAAAPPLGSPVTFKYSGLTDSGQPRFASFVAVRNYE